MQQSPATNSTGNAGEHELENNRSSNNIPSASETEAPNQIPSNLMPNERVNSNLQAIKLEPIIRYRLAIKCKENNNNRELKRGHGYDPEQQLDNNVSPLADKIISKNTGDSASASDQLIHLDLIRKRDNHFIKRLLTSNNSSIKRLASNLSFNFDLKQDDFVKLADLPLADIESQLIIVASFTDSDRNPLSQQPNITLPFIDSDNNDPNQLSRQSANDDDATNNLSRANDSGKSINGLLSTNAECLQVQLILCCVLFVNLE